MEKHTLLALVLGSVLVLSGCGSNTTQSTGSSASVDTASSTGGTSSSAPASSSSIVATKLATPVLALNEGKTGLTWDAVAHASKYQLKVNDGAYADATSYDFSGTVGEYTIKVKAIGDITNYTDSDEATWSYKTKTISLSDLSQTGMTVSWTAVGVNVAVGFSATGTIAEADWSAATGSTYTATASGKIGVEVSAGYDAAGNVNYVGDKVEKYSWVIKKASANKAVLDENTSVADDVASFYYGSTGWVDASSYAALTVDKADSEESEKSINFSIVTGLNYKFENNVVGLDAYEGISVTVRGDGVSTLVFQMEGAWGYASYSLGVINTNWHTIYVPFAASGWTVNGGSTTFNEFAVSQGFISPAAAMYAVSKIDVVWKTVANNYARTQTFIKEMVLVADNAGATGSDAQDFAIGGIYTGVNSAGQVFQLKQKDDGYVLETLNLYTNLSVGVVLSKESDQLTMTSADSGASITYVGKVSEKGRKITFVSAAGTYGSFLQNVNLSYVYNVDNFESYTETGVGHDSTHTAADRTGLRGAYYVDLYNEGTSGDSATGDSHWCAAGNASLSRVLYGTTYTVDATDYLALDQTEANAHSGKQSAVLENNGAMPERYLSYGLIDGSSVAYPKGNTFSLWMSNPMAKVVKATIRLFKTIKFSGNAGDYVESTITLSANSSWTQYTFAIDASATYYGYQITMDMSWSFAGMVSTLSHPCLDDVQIYSDANPWTVYSEAIPAGAVMSGSTAGLTSVTATYGHDSAISVVAVDALGTSHNLSGSYAIDSNNNIVIDCGADLKYVGVISSDKTAIKYTSATGTFATYVADLFLQEKLIGAKTVIENFENMTAAAAQAKYTVDQDANNASWATLSSNSDKVSVSTETVAGGFASGQFAMDTTAAKVGKYRYRFAQTDSFGAFGNFSIRVKNASSLPVVGYLYMCTASGTSASDRVQTSIYCNLPANTDWTTFTGAWSGGSTTAKAIYGYSFFFTATAPTTEIVTGSIFVDNVLAW